MKAQKEKCGVLTMQLQLPCVLVDLESSYCQDSQLEERSDEKYEQIGYMGMLKMCSWYAVCIAGML